jgi:hypothetical protein
MKTIAIAAAGMLAFAEVAVTTGAEAGCDCCGIAPGVIGGVAPGAIVGGAFANPGPYPGSAVVPGYAPYPAYAGAAPVACLGGFWARRPLVDRFGNVVGYSRPRYLCP